MCSITVSSSDLGLKNQEMEDVFSVSSTAVGRFDRSVKAFQVRMPGSNQDQMMQFEVYYNRNGQLKLHDFSDDFSAFINQVAQKLHSKHINAQNPSFMTSVREQMGWSLDDMLTDFSTKEQVVDLIGSMVGRSLKELDRKPLHK